MPLTLAVNPSATKPPRLRVYFCIHTRQKLYERQSGQGCGCRMGHCPILADHADGHPMLNAAHHVFDAPRGHRPVCPDR